MKFQHQMAYAVCLAGSLTSGLWLVQAALGFPVAWDFGAALFFLLFVGTAARRLGKEIELEDWQRYNLNYAQQVTNEERAARVEAMRRAAELVEPAAPDYSRDWKVATRHFVTAGERYGFSIRDLGAGEHQIVAWDRWAEMTAPLLAAGWLEQDGKGTRWAEGRTYEQWRDAQGWNSLPYPKQKPPTVKITAATANTTTPNNAPTPSSSTIIDA